MHDYHGRIGRSRHLLDLTRRKRETKRGVACGCAPFLLRRAARGVTLVELTIVLVMLAILTYVVLRFLEPRDALALQQAERLRNDLQHTQMLALTWGQSLQVNAAGGGYSVSCVAAGAPPCNASPVINPADGRPFGVMLEPGLALGGPAALQFDPLGRPRLAGTLTNSAQTYTISGASAPRSVTVAPLTGFARAQ